MKAKPTIPAYLFTVTFPDKATKPLVIEGNKINDFIRTDKRKYKITNWRGEAAFSKTFVSK